MLSIQGVYDGVSVIPEEAIPFRDEYEVIITFLKPTGAKRISSFASENEMVDYINNIGGHFYGRTPDKNPRA
jgi:hypothetical protein